MKNIGQSKLAKLKNLSKSTKKPIMSLLDQYAYMGFLRRLSMSEKWKNSFSLKGGLMIFALTGDTVRPTRDIDLDGVSDFSSEEIKDIMNEILQIDSKDGLVFDIDNLIIAHDATENLISGVKVRTTAFLGTAKVPVHIDVGMQNAITPHVSEVKLPKLLDDDLDIVINVYPVETTISEKFRAMVSYGSNNTRMKDYYDIYKYIQLMEIDGNILGEAIEKSFKRLDVEVPRNLDIPSFNSDNYSSFIPQFNAFIKKNNLPSEDFSIVASEIKEFLEPVIISIGSNNDLGKWSLDHKSWLSKNINTYSVI